MQNYYLDHKVQLMRQFHNVIKKVRPCLATRYGEEMTTWLETASAREFEAILPTIPYVGGRSNMFTRNLLGAAWLVALYKALKARGRSLDEIAEVSNEIYRAYLAQYPRWFWRVTGWLYLHGLYRWQMKRAAARSQKREYPHDWVLRYVPGDGKTFDLGVDFTQCAICKLCHDQGADEFLPHLCETDYIECEALNIDLDRKHTLAAGDPLCDFRLKRRAAHL